MTIIVALLFLSILSRALTQRCTLPYVQVVAEIDTADPPLIQAFSVPLFDNDCFFIQPAKPILTNGTYSDH